MWLEWQEKILSPAFFEGTDVSGNASNSDGGTDPPIVSDNVESLPKEPEPKKDPWFLKRIDTLTARSSALEQQLAMEKQLREAAEARIAGQEQKPIQPTQYTEQEVQARALAIAAAENFNRECNEVAKRGIATFPDFMFSVENLNKFSGGLPQAFIEASFETGIPEKVMYNLGKNPEKAMEILALPSTKQAVALTKYALELEKNTPKKVSDVPPPIEPKIGGIGKVESSLDDPNLSIDEWMKIRNRQAARI